MRLLTFSRLRWLLPLVLVTATCADAAAGPLARLRARRSGCAFGSCTTSGASFSPSAGGCSSGRCPLK